MRKVFHFRSPFAWRLPLAQSLPQSQPLPRALLLPQRQPHATSSVLCRGAALRSVRLWCAYKTPVGRNGRGRRTSTTWSATATATAVAVAAAQKPQMCPGIDCCTCLYRFPSEMTGQVQQSEGCDGGNGGGHNRENRLKA